MSDSYQRFSRVVENYLRYRPHYPQQIADFLKEECGLSPNHTIADIGSGTGILSQVFLKNGNTVYGVEPNQEMRQAAESLLQDQPNFRSVDATAEATSLGNNSVDFVTAGQAFHWFKHADAREEFSRILVPKGWVVLVWNLLRHKSSDFALGFGDIWRKYVGSNEVFAEEATKIPDYLVNFFLPNSVKEKAFDNYQVCDFEALKGRVLSVSNSPDENDERYQPLLNELTILFDRNQVNGQVKLEYDTRVVYGQLD
jgi:ubiquinone/menaquinone biosynthesis C-methylase UbiE